MHQPGFQDFAIRRGKGGHGPEGPATRPEPGADGIPVSDFIVSGQEKAPHLAVQPGRHFQDGLVDPAAVASGLDYAPDEVQAVRKGRHVQLERLLRFPFQDGLAVHVRQLIDDWQNDVFVSILDRPG